MIYQRAIWRQSVSMSYGD